MGLLGSYHSLIKQMPCSQEMIYSNDVFFGLRPTYSKKLDSSEGLRTPQWSEHLHFTGSNGVGVRFRSPLRSPSTPFNQGGQSTQYSARVHLSGQ